MDLFTFAKKFKFTAGEVISESHCVKSKACNTIISIVIVILLLFYEIRG